MENNNEINLHNLKESRDNFLPTADKEMLKEQNISKEEIIKEIEKVNIKLNQLRFAHGNPELIQEKKKYYIDQVNTYKVYIKENYDD